MQRYTKTAMLLHWLTALLIISAFFLGLVMTDIHGITPTKLKYYSWHKWLGITVLALACMHVLLYLLIFAVPLSGYFYTCAAGVPVVYLGLFQLPSLIEPNPELKPLLQAVHYWMTMTMAALVVAHALADVKHHFIDRDDVLKRMLPKV